MRTLRLAHLYLGCVFAPLLIFYAITGAWQCFDWHLQMKNAAPPPAWIVEMSRVHMDAKVVVAGAPRMPGGYFRYYVLLMSAGLVLTTVLGVIMAFKVTRRKWIVCACLALGMLIPWLLVNY